MNNLFYICNALDDVTRIERGIFTDSPASSRKIFLICHALRLRGVHATVISLGRGRQDGTGRYFRGKMHRINGVAVIYLPFLHFPVLSELLSMFCLVPILWRMRSKKGAKAALFYNRLPAYLFGLALARVLQFRTILDLEDGLIDLSFLTLAGIRNRLLTVLFDFLCSDGAMLACRALQCMTNLRPTYCCYGTYEVNASRPSRNLFPITVLLGGTVSFSTGAKLLIDAIKILREEAPPWVANIQFEISGKGDCLNQFIELADDARKPKIIVHGRTTDDGYKQVLARTLVGLALKPNSGALAHTTFPSKVIEFASHGILVITTDISDVRNVLAEGAIYLTEDNPRQLIEKLHWIEENREDANILALLGEQSVSELCSPEVVGKALDRFIFGATAGLRN